jgi:threonine dehydrogenase-like Zn-dependent dehydrogenase
MRRAPAPLVCHPPGVRRTIFGHGDRSRRVRLARHSRRVSDLSDQSVAAVLVAPEQFELQEFPLPAVGDDDGLLKVEAAGICGSDWAQFQGKSTGLPPVYPIIPGHEIVGRIHQVGQRAATRWGVEVGDLVAVGMTIPSASLSSPTVYGLTQSTGTIQACGSDTPRTCIWTREAWCTECLVGSPRLWPRSMFRWPMA